VLGGAEPAFRQVLADRVEGLLGALDGGELARALVALGEDGEVVAQVLAGLVRRDPALPGRAAATALACGAPLVRGLVDLLREANQLPEEALRAAAGQIDAGLDRSELAALARELAALARRLDEAGATAPVARALAAALDQDAVDDAALRALRSLGEALAASPRARRRLEPEALGRWITTLLRRINGAFAGATADRPAYLSRVMAAVDPDELEEAWGNTLSALTGTGAASAPLVRAVARPILAAGWRAARIAVASRGARPRRRAGRGDGRRRPWASSS